jgi:hypothetical protein
LETAPERFGYKMVKDEQQLAKLLAGIADGGVA